MTANPLDELARLGCELGEAAQRLGGHVVTAESCTAGLIAVALTETGGSSAWFERGIASYSNAAKQELLGVSASDLAAHGAVSEIVAARMARGALLRGGERACVALAVTGIAGPGGGSAAKPVGTVCFGWALRLPGAPDAAAEPVVETTTRHFQGDRRTVRIASARFALEQATGRLARFLADRPPTA